MIEESEFVILSRFKIVEALLEEWCAAMPRDAGRQRLALANVSPEIRAAALAWFDLRWPEEP